VLHVPIVIVHTADRCPVPQLALAPWSPCHSHNNSCTHSGEPPHFLPALTVLTPQGTCNPPSTSHCLLDKPAIFLQRQLSLQRFNLLQASYQSFPSLDTSPHPWITPPLFRRQGCRQQRFWAKIRLNPKPYPKVASFATFWCEGTDPTARALDLCAYRVTVAMNPLSLPHSMTLDSNVLSIHIITTHSNKANHGKLNSHCGSRLCANTVFSNFTLKWKKLLLRAS